MRAGQNDGNRASPDHGANHEDIYRKRMITRFPSSQGPPFFTDQGASKIEEAFGIDNLYGMEHQELLHNVTQALKARAIMKLDVDYIVIDGKVAIIDKFTGRVMEGRSFSDGLHQAIEAKEDWRFPKRIKHRP
ncbi:hypothetical protein RCO48_13100 [Peribacillus frigoritolerans]|nr:hypothetical protein [Peribacillus frigoritolerans]